MHPIAGAIDRAADGIWIFDQHLHDRRHHRDAYSHDTAISVAAISDTSADMAASPAVIHL
jgi:hypothetical protein